MRLFIIPISTRRALIYSRPLRKDLPKELSWTDKITNKAAQTWAKWEEAEKGWKMHLVSWGNRVQQRIPYQEWGLKSIPSLNAQRRLDPSHGSKKIDVLFPGNAIDPEKLQSLLARLATERQDLHRQRMWWSFIAAPFTAPIALLPVHLEYLVKNNLLNPISFPGLEQLYAKRVSRTLENIEPEKPPASMVEDVEKSDDRLLLRMKDAKKLASILEAPELALEAERAIIQVEEQLKAQESSEGKEKDTKKSA
ncbi:mitochondrial K+-H+ exchange-related-domain-containing protein [Aspergillus terreus]|uniref:Mitochondrial K+-H+ exchange-related-domain-containing protein n=1 Tax=Aspergillus terreus TaxID=33178 RepID=A0A5M3YVX2_ASPTE|nr:hypothetical protein ATETN484_0003043700 [Aspergillus terreus]GFF14426.1 mitochondrial K+-H+ exchange-related-domain-containing protein [Aspergillus terreus]